MASSVPTGQRVQTWLEPSFAAELKEFADADGRSVSGLIRHVLELEIAKTSPTSGGDRAPRRDPSSPPVSAGSEGS